MFVVDEEFVFGALGTIGVDVVKLREVGVDAVVGQFLLQALGE